MKIKMEEMGMKIDGNISHRMRGIIPTKDGKYLFIEISQGNRPDIQYTSLSKDNYKLRYPNENYIWVGCCFRVDIPYDYRNKYSPEFEEYDRQPFYELVYSKENIIKLFKELNNDIEDVELVEGNYIDKFCEEKGFFELYDERLKHSYKPIEIRWISSLDDGKTLVKSLYTCYSANGTKYSTEKEISTTMKELIKENGKEVMQNLLNDYLAKKCSEINDPELEQRYSKEQERLFRKSVNELELDEYSDIDI